MRGADTAEAAAADAEVAAAAAAAPPVPPAVARRAVEWLVELQSAETGDAARDGLERWRQQHPDHERAWQRIAAVNAQWRSALGGSAAAGRAASPFVSQVARGALLDAPQAGPHQARRRDAIKTLALLFGAGGGAWLAQEHTPWRAWSADERTGVGQRRTIALADGGSIDLNTGTAINVRYSGAERRVHLVSGEILVRTGKDGAGRPFVVETVQGELRPLGTHFAVRQHAAHGRVDVFEGAVSVQPRGGPGRILQAGELARFSGSAVSPAEAVNGDSIAWSDGMLVASGMRLDDFLAEVGRYRHGRLGCDPAIAGLRVSGSYPLADTGLILDTLRATLPVETQFITRYWVTLRPAHR
ncbi:FecR domain-containing protein [Massilia sp. Root351]|jgi:transmembrane sensor|uniref:FecR domain-containing protein n=1 Tax=Massilia sp. Root351 TaxID=1736522 RepID=UPI0009E6BBA1|nr:FecR domain-containing protein [Massilia sp. Root351]